MVTNENNSFINSFTKGMNSDGAFDLLLNTQYIYGQNVRITKNQFLSGSNDYSSVHEGIVTPVPTGVDLVSPGSVAGRILSVQSIERLATIVTGLDSDKSIHVYKLKLDETTDQVEYLIEVWSATNVWKKGDIPGKISTVLYKELENVVKLYIATGEHPIISLRVDDDSVTNLKNKYITNGVYTDIDNLINNRIVPNDRIYIDDVISGRLTTGQVLYTYRYYNKYGNTTLLAPLTNKILVIDPSRSKETGNAENTETSIGFSITINIEKYKTDYDRLLVFRLHYIIPGLDAEVSLIYDGKIKESTTNTFVLNDVGIDPLLKLSMEEFSAMSGLILIPQVIEQNQEYMFCGNITDDTIIPGVTINKSDNYSVVKSAVVLSDKIEGDIPDEGNHLYYNGEYNTLESSNINVPNDITVSNYLKQRGINPTLVKASYNNIFTSSLLRSLRRGERYKYAIVFYDRYGRRTDVLNICDVLAPEYDENRPFGIENGSLVAYPLGVKIQIPSVTWPESVSNNDIIGCQIVRRSSSEVYQNTLLLVALARPISQGILDLNIDDLSTITENNIKYSPFYPSGFLSVSGLYIIPDYYMPNMNGSPAATQNMKTSLFWGGHYLKLAAKTKNHKLFLIFSSEIDFRRNDVLSRINTSDATITEMLYMPSIFAKYANSSKSIIYDNTLPYSDKYDEDIVEATLNTIPQTIITNTVLPETTLDDDKLRYRIPSEYIDMTKSVYFSFTSSDANRIDLLYIDQNQNVVYGPTVFTNQDVSANYYASGFITRSLANHYNLYAEVSANASAGTMYIKLQSRSESTNEDEGYLVMRRDRITKLSSDAKLGLHYIFNFYQTLSSTHSGFGTNNINQVKDVKIPNWDSGFNEIYRDGKEHIATGIRKYKSYSTNIDSYTYNNWVSCGKYDLRAGYLDSQTNMAGWGENEENQELLGTYEDYQQWNKDDEHTARCGFIGPGPSCFILTTEKETGAFPLWTPSFYTSICNIKHNPKSTDVQSDDFTQYYGFGNYFNLEVHDNKLQTYIVDTNGNKQYSEYLTVFDGDVYITPHEFTTIYKAYEFNSTDTLLSILVTNYIPLESKVNTYFDYGMNLRNTTSENLIYEPGHIDGVTTLDRPVHQYNMVYSDNDASNDVFTLITTDPDETNNFRQRTYYSDLKTNGEFIDNFLIFKTASFIDVDSKYGQITNLLTDKNLLYYWQDHACGRFSVNERSLINDQNSNTIMLGQAGILSRYDYISTRYGMRLYDFCAKSTEGGVFWVDINNKAIAALAENKAINYGELLNVQNIINNKITSDIPKVDYDLQNDEVLCKCFGNDQMIFNIKYNLATSVYTRRYDDILYIKNHIYGLTASTNLAIKRYNYIIYADNNNSFLSPLLLSFVVNPTASVTKVFDSQQMIPIKRDAFTKVDHTNILDGSTMLFETDIVKKFYGNDMEPYTDREGNIIYNVPRYTEGNGYGNRIRGKWMRVDINNDNPMEYFTISHIITKFRQSYS